MQDCENILKYKKELGLIVKKYRLQEKKSISLICDEIDMTKSMWADLERGVKDPQLSTILRIAEALNVPASVIINELENVLGKNFTFSD